MSFFSPWPFIRSETFDTPSTFILENSKSFIVISQWTLVNKATLFTPYISKLLTLLFLPTISNCSVLFSKLIGLNSFLKYNFVLKSILGILIDIIFFIRAFRFIVLLGGCTPKPYNCINLFFPLYSAWFEPNKLLTIFPTILSLLTSPSWSIWDICAIRAIFLLSISSHFLSISISFLGFTPHNNFLTLCHSADSSFLFIKSFSSNK